MASTAVRWKGIFREGRIKEIADYCEIDVVNTYRVRLRYELFRGRSTKAAHQASELNLIEFIKRHQNTKQHLSGIVTGNPS
jgi:predicted PolB exonuclease-like 3'-5' exonuclease